MSNIKDLFEFIYKNWGDNTRWNVMVTKMDDLVSELCCKDENFLESWMEFLLKKNGATEEMIPFILESLCVPELKDWENERIIQETPDVLIKLKWIEEQPKHDQRTPEWYETRHNCITASMISKVLGTVAERQSALIDKISQTQKNISYGTAAKHGIKYEAMAQRIYETENKVKISEYGCIIHKDIPYLASSPDGIVTETKGDDKFMGRMLEIKCVYTRLINGLPKKEYWMQTQIQLEVCNLEYCDFFECDIKEYSEEQFKNILMNEKCEEDKYKQYYGVCVETREKSTNEEDGKTHYEYLFSKDYDTLEDLLRAKDAYIDGVIEKVEYIKDNYWILNGFSCLTIRRNRDWFSSVKNTFKEFWDDVEKCRNDEAFAIKLCTEKQQSVVKKTVKKKVEKVVWLGD